MTIRSVWKRFVRWLARKDIERLATALRYEYQQREQLLNLIAKIKIAPGRNRSAYAVTTWISSDVVEQYVKHPPLRHLIEHVAQVHFRRHMHGVFSNPPVREPFPELNISPETIETI